MAPKRTIKLPKQYGPNERPFTIISPDSRPAVKLTVREGEGQDRRYPLPYTGASRTTEGQ